MVFVSAEIGINHNGDLKIAKQLIDAAVFAGCNAVKFQKRTPKELLTDEEYNSAHPNKINSYGDTYGKHREYLEFNKDQHKQLQLWCNEYGVEYSSSVWDLTAARDIIDLNPKTLKIPSACNLNFELLQLVSESFQGEIHISFGMTTKDEEEEIVNFFENNYRNKDLVIYSCTSGYPVKFEEICLFEIKRLYENFGNRVKKIGFSGHHLGIAIDNAAYTLGARWIERHFTKDRTWRGTDHAASLEPDGLRKLVRNLNACYSALTYKISEILEIERVQRDKLKYKK